MTRPADGQSPGDRASSPPSLARLQQEFAGRLPEIQRYLEVFQADPTQWGSLDQVRDYFHKLAGVAAPCGAPTLGALAKVGEELVVLVASGKVPVVPGVLRMLDSCIRGTQTALTRPDSADPLPSPSEASVESSEAGALALPGARKLPPDAPKILIVDDDPLSARLIELCLGSAGFSTLYCADPREAIAFMDSHVPDLILLDLIMPGQDGFQTCRQIRTNATSDRVPIIFLTRVSDLDEKVKALRSGGDDYIMKPFEPVELVARVRAHLQRHAAVREQLIRDALTGAFTHRYFKQRLGQEIRKQQTTPSSLSVAMIDVDHFKEVNDTLGHAAGDALLKGLVQKATEAVRKNGLVARYGGDEFAVIFPDCPASRAAALLERFVQSMSTARFPVGEGRQAQANVSVGVAEWRPGEAASLLTERADRAAYNAKKQGRGRLVLAEAGPVPEATSPESLAGTDAKARQFTILLVDDSRLTREVLKLYLTSIHVNILDAENGQEALESIRKSKPNLVLADLRMPKLDGLGLLKAIHADASTSSTPVIILTGHLDPQVYERCIAEGAKEVLAKPIEPLELLNVVNRYLERRR